MFFDLCGPGAADVALEYWPWPPNTRNYTVYEPINGQTTTWYGRDRDNILRARGYMLHLAYEINPPTWGRAGLNMQQYPTVTGQGATLPTMRDGLNWEASGEGSLWSWSNYFYLDEYTYAPPGVPAGQTNRTQSALHGHVMSDIAYQAVPVVVMVNTNGLPNWNFSGNTIHFITIIGYNDDAGTYDYTDTCAHLTGCGSQYDGGIRTATQTQLYNATYGWDW